MRYRLGIVFSGGGMRGAAHAGVLAALAEEGIEPDVASGTSSGALVGALWAAGRSPQEICDFFAESSPFRWSKLALGLGKPGLLDAEKIEGDFLQAFPENSFEALKRPLFITATDLVRARLEVFSSGPLVRPLLASSAVPMVFTPVEINGSLYADGGILDNFPVTPLVSVATVILGVLVSRLSTTRVDDLTSSWGVAQRAFEVAQFHNSKRDLHRCSLVLQPSGLEAFNLFDVKSRAEIFEAGRAAAKARMPEIVELLRAG